MTKLKNVYQINLTPTKPFNFDATFHKPDHFTSGDNLWEPGLKWQTFNHKREKLGIVFQNKGTINNPCINVLIHCNKKLSDGFINDFAKEVRYRYNLDFDLTEFYKKFKNDKVLSPIFTKWEGMRPGHPSSLYEYLIIGIVLQNATVKRSIQMFQSLLEKLWQSS
ncbi:hypothetical protein ACFL2C_03675 [Patescibacteria group bacterium]